MGSNISFGNWDSVIHTQPDQIKRMASARKKDTSPSSVDKETKSAIFPGSGKNPYTTSLNECTCGDFLRRHLPCKHIYRLAMELGIMDGRFNSGLNKNLALSLQESVAIIENFTDEQEQFIKRLLPQLIAGKNPVEEYISGALEPVLSCPLLVFAPSSLKSILNDYRKTDIEAMLSQIQRLPDKKLLKGDLITYCCDKIPELRLQLPSKYIITASEQFGKSIRKTYTYLCRKYDWMSIYDENMVCFIVPYGSDDASGILGNCLHGLNGLYCFPNDEITALLSFYGHNRCENGFTPLEDTL